MTGGGAPGAAGILECLQKNNLFCCKHFKMPAAPGAPPPVIRILIIP